LEKRKHIIIGTGTAALTALKQIRKINLEDEVKLITKEPYLPYSPTSLPYVISGRIKDSEISLATEAFFDEMKAQLVRGKSVGSIDTIKNEVVYDSGERESYDTLLIATGSEPVLPPIPGLEEDMVVQLRTLDDAKGVLAKVAESKTAIILGAGLIGMHVAQCLAEKGVKVSVVEMLPQILPAYFDSDAAMVIRYVLEKQGITFYTSRKASKVARKAKGIEVSLEAGETLQADMLLVATGVKPRTSFLAGSGIEVNQGIVVDDEMRTSVPNVFAAGDVASAKGFLTGEKGVNPILPNAAEQGKVAGSNMVGQKTEYDGWLPMNTFSFFGHPALSVGKAMPSDGEQVLVEKGNGKRGYRKIICKDDRLVGAAFVDTDLNGGVIQYLIKKKVDVSQHKQNLVRSPRETSLWLMREAENRETISMEE
jgi:phenylglyoxylate dehydrogenase epsilon subunit